MIYLSSYTLDKLADLPRAAKFSLSTLPNCNALYFAMRDIDGTLIVSVHGDDVAECIHKLYDAYHHAVAGAIYHRKVWALYESTLPGTTSNYLADSL